MIVAPSCIYQKLEMEKIAVFQVMVDSIQKEIIKLAHLTMLQQSLSAGHSTADCQECISLRLKACSPMPQYFGNSLEKAPLLGDCFDNYKTTIEALLKQASLFLSPANVASPHRLSQSASEHSAVKEFTSYELNKDCSQEKSKESSFDCDLQIKKEDTVPEEVEETSEHTSQEKDERVIERSVPKIDKLQNSGFKPKATKDLKKALMFKNVVLQDKLLSALNRVIQINLANYLIISSSNGKKI